MRPATLRLLLAAAVMTGPAAQAATSSFDTDAEGWTSVFNGSSATVDWADGAISAVDITDGWAYLRAPASYLAAITPGGSFSFDLRHEVTGTRPRDYGVRVALTSGSTTVIAEAAAPTSGWLRYSFALAEGAGWRSFSDNQQNYSSSAPLASQATLAAVLADLRSVDIATDYTDANLGNGLGIDRTYIDNVQLLAAPVPEPGSWGLMAAGLGSVGWLARRRRR